MLVHTITNEGRKTSLGECDAVLSLTNLEALGGYGGPVVPLELHRRPSLRRLVLGDYIVSTHEDGTLPSLTELTLETVSGFTTAWFPPKLLGCLETLVLLWLDEETTQIVTHILQGRPFFFTL